MQLERAYTVFGAGSVGTVLAGLMRDRGLDVAIAGRNATSTLHLEGDDETVRVDVPVVDEPQGTILLCVHESQVPELAQRFRGRTVVTFSNGVTAEEIAARSCSVIGGVWRMTCMLIEPGHAWFVRRGRIVLGSWDGTPVGSIADDLRAAGFDVGVSSNIAADIWLKLLCNIGSTPNAIIRNEDHVDPRFGELKAALASEAWCVLQRNGINAASCDGKDASPTEEIERQRRVGPRARAVNNDTWRRLAQGRQPDERYHRTIVSLGDAPLNAAMDQLLDRATGPACFTLDEAARSIGWTSR